MMKISWMDMIPHIDILRRASSLSIENLILQRRLRWAGHVRRMPEHRLPRQVFYGEFSTGHRSVGGQKKRYKDQLSKSLRSCGIPPHRPGSSLLPTRVAWRAAVQPPSTQRLLAPAIEICCARVDMLVSNNVFKLKMKRRLSSLPRRAPGKKGKN